MPTATADHAERNLQPEKIFLINVAVLLRKVMSRESFYWLYDDDPLRFCLPHRAPTR
jgi:hypothetical protein